MTARRRFCFILALTTCITGVAHQGQEDLGSTRISRPATTNARNVVVRRTPVDLKRRTFDPRNPPAEMPRLAPSEDAITHADYGISTLIDYAILDQGRDGSEFTYELRINRLTIDTALAITVWLPQRARAKLREHEEGHRKLFEHWYNSAAESAAREAAQPFIGKIVRGRGADANEAKNNATKQVTEPITRAYMDRIYRPSAKANEEFDRLTRHGNSEMSVEEAIRRSLDAAQ